MNTHNTPGLKAEVLSDLAKHLSSISGSVVEISFADKGGSKINRARYHQSISGEELESYASKAGQSVFFLAGIDPQRANLNLNMDVIRQTKDDMVAARNIISLDADFKDTIPGFEKLAPAEKSSIIRSTFHKHHAKLKASFGDVYFAVISGNGLHLHFKLRNPLECTDKALYEAGYKLLIERVEAAFGGEVIFDRTCCNPARVMRLPESTNWKDSTNPLDVPTIHFNKEASADLAISAIWELAEARLFMSQEKHKPTAAGLDPFKNSLRDALTLVGILHHWGYTKTETIQDLGGGELRCSSPWKTDSDPSCYLNEGKKLFKDFSSGKGGDVFNFIAELHGLTSKADFPRVLDIAGQITGLKPQTSTQKVNVSPSPAENIKARATYEDYASFFDRHLPEASRDILSGRLMFKAEGEWESAQNNVKLLQSYALDTDHIKKGNIEPHLAKYERSKPKKLLVDIPAWDGVDRLAVIASCVHLKNCTQDTFLEYLKEWGANIFRRVQNPEEQNWIMVLKSKTQGIGKDFLVRSMLKGGLQRYFTDASISDNERDNYVTLAQHLVVNIAEFDRTSRVAASTIKALVTGDHVTIVNKYERDPSRLNLRCSFIASCNVDDILRDHTGNRRFAVFDIEKIDFNYPTTESVQIVAQFKALAESDFRVSEKAKEAMKAYITEQTPEDPKELILSDFDSRIQAFEEKKPSSRGAFDLTQLREVFDDMKRLHGLSLKELQNLLKREGRSKRTNRGMVYFRRNNRGSV